MNVIYAPAALSDLDDIWDYTAEKWGVAQAKRYTKVIYDTALDLASGEKQGRKVNSREGYLKYPAGLHLIFFRTMDNGIEVIRILHQNMDVERRL
jgi:toxin ParE1/3/4